MRILRVLLNQDSDEPTAGLRGLLCLCAGIAAPFFLDWRTMLLPLLIAVVCGLGLGVAMLGQAWEDSSENLQE